MKYSTALLTIFAAICLSDCAVVEPARSVAATPKVSTCQLPADGWQSAYIDSKSGACAWRKDAECYVQTSRETRYSVLGAAVRPCINPMIGAAPHGPVPERVARSSRLLAFDGDDMCLDLSVYSPSPEPPGDGFRRMDGCFAEPRSIARLDLVP